VGGAALLARAAAEGGSSDACDEAVPRGQDLSSFFVFHNKSAVMVKAMTIEVTLE
jgi:hypothetical protein